MRVCVCACVRVCVCACMYVCVRVCISKWNKISKIMLEYRYFESNRISYDIIAVVVLIDSKVIIIIIIYFLLYWIKKSIIRLLFQDNIYFNLFSTLFTTVFWLSLDVKKKKKKNQYVFIKRENKHLLTSTFIFTLTGIR